MGRVAFWLALLAVSSHGISQESPINLNCKCLEKINKDYGPVEVLSDVVEWSPADTASPLRDRIFLNLDSETPKVVSITPPYKYFPEGEIHEFQATVIHRGTNTVTLIWENPHGNKVWVAAVNLEVRQAVVTQFYDGLFSFGVNTETLDCVKNGDGE